MKTLNVGEKVLTHYLQGYYSDEISCLNDKNHKVMWWYNGAFCLNECKYVSVITLEKSRYFVPYVPKSTDYNLGYDTGYHTGFQAAYRKGKKV